MFRTGSPYSPFFTSGLLSASSSRSPSPLPLPSPVSPPAARRGSLPTDSASYFARPPKRDPSVLRSFLSLDLAESPSLRSASKPRKPPTPRDSIRSIPHPKPAPSITLPDLPVTARPSPVVITRTAAPAAVVPLPKRNSTSTVSTSVRRSNRSQALARLEGRTASTRRRRTRLSSRPNFMSMSDDENADEEDNHPITTFNALHEPEDIVLPPPSPPHTAPLAGRFPSSLSPPSPKSPKDWFPLNSFIDLQAEDDASSFKVDFNMNFAVTTWSWRSFVEVASVS